MGTHRSHITRRPEPGDVWCYITPSTSARSHKHKPREITGATAPAHPGRVQCALPFCFALDAFDCPLRGWGAAHVLGDWVQPSWPGRWCPDAWDLQIAARPFASDCNRQFTSDIPPESNPKIPMLQTRMPLLGARKLRRQGHSQEIPADTKQDPLSHQGT